MDENLHLLRTELPKGILIMQWTRGLLAQDLEDAKEIVLLQLDACIRRANKKTYAELEYPSWSAS